MGDVIAPQGKLDLAAVGDLHAQLVAQSTKDTVCDLSGVTHLGALCLQTFMAAANAAQLCGVRFDLHGISDHVREQVATMGVDIETLREGTT